MQANFLQDAQHTLTPTRRHFDVGKTSEWYTPSKYIEPARYVMGGIDLDPASCAKANQTVRAMNYFTVEDNGLRYAWWGRVWLNPPYSGHPGQAAEWAAKLLESYKSGKVAQAMMLVNLSTVYQPAMLDLGRSGLLCIVAERIRFTDATGTAQSSPPQANVIYYLGSKQATFASVFGEFGLVCKPMSI